MDAKKYNDLLEKKKKAEVKLADAKQRLGHPHLDFMSSHDLAESEFNLWTAYLEDIEKQIRELKKKE